MDILEILTRIEELSAPSTQMQFALIPVGGTTQDIYFGKDNNAHLVFAMLSPSPLIQPSHQKTSKLLFWFNAACSISVGNAVEHPTMHVLTCLSDDADEKLAFIRLSLSFSDVVSIREPKKLSELFTALTNLFANDRKVSGNEMQGFYAELYTIRFFHQKGLDVYKFWQKKDKLNFDFSVSARKRIEIKSTINEIRVHHFKHEQLLSDLYDIRIISFLLRRDDAGLSLSDLIAEVRSIAANDFETLIYIERFVKNISNEELAELKFDAKYLDSHMKIYNAMEIPRFSNQPPEGVTQTEYNSDLSTAESISEIDIIKWIKEDNYVQNI